MTAAIAQPQPFVSYADYCRLEAQSEQKHDYEFGKVVPVPGGSLNHSRIIANIGREIGIRLLDLDGPCEYLESSFRVAFPDHTYSHYTDGMILCGPPEIDPEDPTGHSLTNPTAIIEVQSPSTGVFDLKTKFKRYRELPSFREYVVAFQDVPEILNYFKQPDGTWLFSSYAGTTGDMELRSINIKLPLAGIYARVEFPLDPPSEQSPDGR